MLVVGSASFICWACSPCHSYPKREGGLCQKTSNVFGVMPGLALGEEYLLVLKRPPSSADGLERYEKDFIPFIRAHWRSDHVHRRLPRISKQQEARGKRQDHQRGRGGWLLYCLEEISQPSLLTDGPGSNRSKGGLHG